MNKMFNNIQKNWKRIVSVVMVLVLVITSVNLEWKWSAKEAKAAAGDYIFTNGNGEKVAAGGEMDLHRATDRLSLTEPQTGDRITKWESSQPDILEVEDTTGFTNNVKAKRVGKVEIRVTIIHANDPTETPDIKTLTVNVVFSINEFMNTTLSRHGYAIDYIHEKDARKALIMNYGQEVYFGNDATASDQQDKLNLIFGEATAPKDVVWESSNREVVEIVDSTDSNKGVEKIVTKGAGVATLSVTYFDGTSTYSASILVYVRPQVKLNLWDKLNEDERPDTDVIAEGAMDTQTIDLEKANLTKEDLDNIKLEITNTGGAISEKLIWVITKMEGEKEVLVQDSLGHVESTDAKLTWLNQEDKYRVDAKAGEYEIKFYVWGTYTDFESAKAEEEEDRTNTSSGEDRKKQAGCPYISFKIRIPANYEDKTVTVNLNGSYNLAEAFNIPADVLKEKFIITIDNTSDGLHDGVDSNVYISKASDGVTINADRIGYGRVKITPRQGANINIPGVTANMTVSVIIHVIDTLNLNQTNAVMTVGTTLDLRGIIGSNPSQIDEDRLSWSISNKDYLDFVEEPYGLNATVRALRPTPIGGPVVVTLTWRDDEGVNHTATCSIIIQTAESSLKITPDTVMLNAGGSGEILSTNLSGTQNLNWYSSDSNSVAVTPMDGSTKATIVAPANAKPGQYVITVVNMDNGVAAYCLVTVSAPMTSINININNQNVTEYTAVLVEGFVQMTANWQPANATNTELEWDSDNKKVATVDDYGRVTLLQEGTARITVQPKYNPNNIYANCDLHIVADPITQITPDVTELEMITGDTYEVALNIIPENPSDRTIRWSSSDESVATVKDGVITAVRAGEAIISISGGLVGRPVSEGEDYIPPAQIKVKVRNRIQKIEFGQKVMYVPLGGTRELTVIFTPDVDINDTLIWNSSDTSVVTVSDEGILTGVAIGTAMVTCYAEDMGPENLISCMVYVTDQTIIPAKGLTLLPEESTLEVGQTLQMDAVFDPADTTNKFIQWSSSDTKIATITPEGLVTGIEVGEVTITALYTDTPDGEPWILYSKITVIPATVEATGFDITPDSMNIKVQEKFTITPVFTPENTTDRTVEYQTTDESVAIVSETGVVTGVGAGDCIIQAQANSGGFIATCAVHVEDAIGFSLSPSYREIAVGKSFTIKKVTVPANADKTAVWTSSNTKIATVSSAGKVTARKIGTCTITCTLTEYNQSATCRVKVAKLNSTVKLDKKNIRIGVGSTYTLKATVWSNNSTTPSVKWKSSNKKIASVSSKGKVKGKRVGITKVTVTTKDKIKAKATCRVTVIRRATSIKINKRYALCYIGRTLKLKASVRPKTATIQKISWSSSNRNIAVVSGAGKVTGMSEGDVTITAKATDGSGKKATCLVKVLEEVPATSVVVAQSNLTMKKGDSTKLTYSVLPKNNSDHLSFASDNKRVAKVDSNGKVRAIGTGTANITILAGSGVTTTVVVNVVDLNKYSVRMRQYDTETLRVLGADSNVTWYSSNNRVATVDGGVVTGRRIGSTYIYAYIGGCKLACRVTITSVNKR